MNVTEAVDAVLPTVVDDLAALVAIPSVSSLPAHATDVRASADWIVRQLADLGCADVRVVAEGGGQPGGDRPIPGSGRGADRLPVRAPRRAADR